jgi:hypothetical protein
MDKSEAIFRWAPDKARREGALSSETRAATLRRIYWLDQPQRRRGTNSITGPRPTCRWINTGHLIAPKRLLAELRSSEGDVETRTNWSWNQFSLPNRQTRARPSAPRFDTGKMKIVSCGGRGPPTGSAAPSAKDSQASLR